MTLSNCGISATFLSQHASLDDAWGRAWIEMLRPDVYILDGGMNDRLTDDVALFGRNLNKVVSRWLSAGTADILLVRPNDSWDAATSYLSHYDNVLVATALARGCAYIDDRAALGNYASAVAAGFMTDLIHPSPTGNAQRAAAYLAAFP